MVSYWPQRAACEISLPVDIKNKILLEVVNIADKDPAVPRLKPCSGLPFQKLHTSLLMHETVFLLVRNHCVTRWREQRSLYSYRNWQIGQSDCDITANCGQKEFENHILRDVYSVRLNYEVLLSNISPYTLALNMYYGNGINSRNSCRIWTFSI